MAKEVTICCGEKVMHTVKIEKTELDDTIEKANKLVDTLNEASSIINELASKDVKLHVNVE